MTIGYAAQWQHRVVLLSWATIVYNLLEGATSIALGLSHESVALFGFGADSLVEVGSACLVLWRFRTERAARLNVNQARERFAARAIGWLFISLAVTTMIGALSELVAAGRPQTTVSGIVISSLSLSFMFFLWRAKDRASRALNSITVAKDSACSLACIKLSVILMIGSILFLLAPSLWWVDSAAAILLSTLIAREGWETVVASNKPNFTGGYSCGPH